MKFQNDNHSTLELFGSLGGSMEFSENFICEQNHQESWRAVCGNGGKFENESGASSYGHNVSGQVSQENSCRLNFQVTPHASNETKISRNCLSVREVAFHDREERVLFGSSHRFYHSWYVLFVDLIGCHSSI